MNKKKLPKAIWRAADHTGGAAAASGATKLPDAPAFADSIDRLGGGAAAGEPAHGGDLVELSQVASSAPVAESELDPVPTWAEIDALRRRSRADAIVERHAAYSAVGGVIPIPIANVAGITAIIVRMVKSLSDLYGVPFERDRARTIVIGLLGAAMPTGLATVTTSTLVYVIPGSNLVGLAVSALSAAACTRGIGRVFIEHFENGATSLDLPAIEKR